MLTIRKGDGIVMHILVGLLELLCRHHNIVRLTRRRPTYNRNVYIRTRTDTRVHLYMTMRADTCYAVSLNQIHPRNLQSQRRQFRLTCLASMREYAIDAWPESSMLGTTFWANKSRNGHFFMTIRTTEENAVDSAIGKRTQS